MNHKKIAFNLLIIVSVLATTGCNLSSVTELLYFNRIKYIFPSEDQESQYVFMCKKGSSRKDATLRANQTNQEFQRYMSSVMAEFETTFNDLLEQSTDTGSNAGKKDDFVALTMQASQKLQNQIVKKAQALENKYHCLLIDTIDLTEE